ncbi:MFS transporter [Umezawaea endophytica]|uniref:MFS transporter n=1 Tax=Umezawaea endophytica TaxID=1654476 RepID=A0A9X3A624_9PSEU|nr:MFS transporter [Umezawaea endophytica]MCS7484334.1 MFS transporter [Umezawaea endophytica]
MSRQVNPWAALSALCIGFFMILLDTTIVNVAIPSMIKDLDAGLNEIIWVNSVYLLTYAVPLLLTGRLGDRFGPKRLFMVGLVVFVGSSLWCGLSGSVEMLIVARGVQGLGAAMMTPQTMAFITHLFPPAKRGGPMGMWGAVAGVATVTGPLLGGVLVDNLGWEWIFFVNVPVGVVALVMTAVLVPDWKPGASHSFDPLGILLCCVGLTLVVFGVQEGQQYEWGAVWGPITIPEVISAGVVLLVGFVVWQAVNKKEPLLPLRIFANRNFSLGNAANVLIGFGVTGLFLPLIIYIQSVLGLSAVESGLLTAPMSLLSGVFSAISGKLSDRPWARFLPATGFTLLAIGIALLSWRLEPGIASWELIPELLVCGAGLGMVFAPLANISTRGVDRKLMGAGSGIFNTSRQFGSVLGSAAVGVLLQARLDTHLADTRGDYPVAFADAAGDTMWMLVAVLLVGTACTLAMRRPAAVVAPVQDPVPAQQAG